MTEDEAKARACCGPDDCGMGVMQRAAPDGMGGPGLASPLPGSRRCLGSDCMAWRWASDFNELHAKHPDAPDLKALADGYCGLAGAPR